MSSPSAAAAATHFPWPTIISSTKQERRAKYRRCFLVINISISMFPTRTHKEPGGDQLARERSQGPRYLPRLNARRSLCKYQDAAQCGLGTRDPLVTYYLHLLLSPSALAGCFFFFPSFPALLFSLFLSLPLASSARRPRSLSLFPIALAHSSAYHSLSVQTIPKPIGNNGFWIDINNKF